MTYVYCMIYGTPEEKKTIIEWVHNAHSVVKGPDYTADDPDLQLWVASTLYQGAIEVYQTFYGKLDEAFLDRLYREYSIIATSLRVPPHMWPRDSAAFSVYWTHMLDTLEIDQNAKNVCNDVCYNKVGRFRGERVMSKADIEMTALSNMDPSKSAHCTRAQGGMAYSSTPSRIRVETVT